VADFASCSPARRPISDARHEHLFGRPRPARLPDRPQGAQDGPARLAGGGAAFRRRRTPRDACSGR
jgi:hypothetical protein